MFITTPAQYASAMDDWELPTIGTSDIFDATALTFCYSSSFSTSADAPGHQQPRTGDIMSSILTYGEGYGNPNYREYLAVELTAPLEVGVTYYAEMYVSFAEFSDHATNNISMYFAQNYTYQAITTQLNFTPQITETSIITDGENWVQISGTFEATNAANYLIIGNFEDDASTSFVNYPNNPKPNSRYFVDDVLVTPCMSVSDDQTICAGESVELSASSSTWIGWADELTPSTLISTDTSITVSPEITTTYLAYSLCDTASITVTVNSLEINLGNDTTLCAGEVIILDATTGMNATYLWQDNSMEPTFTASEQGVYWVSVEVDNCIGQDSISVSFNTPPNINLGNDTILCVEETITLNATTEGATYLWQDNSTLPTFVVSEEGDYSVDVTLNNCTVSDDISVAYNTLLDFSLGEDTTLCVGALVTLDASVTGGSYVWSDNSTSDTLVVSQPGIYWVDVTIDNCTKTESIAVDYWDELEINLGNDTIFCEGSELTLNASIPNGSYLWQDNSTNATLNAAEAGLYSVTVSDGNCTTTDAINLRTHPLPKVDLGVDTTLCIGRSLVLASTSPGGTYLWSNESTRSSIIISETGTYWNETTNTCGTTSDSVFVSFIDCSCEVYIPNAFTPNGDGINDLFGPVSDCIFDQYELLIFSRWGNQVFSSSDPDLKWNGSESGSGYYAETGVYSYRLTYLSSEEVSRKTEIGHVVLIR